MKIKAVDKDSIADELGWQPGDTLRAINGRKVQDILEFRYLVADEQVEVELEQAGERVIYEIDKDADDTLGLSFEPLRVRMCGNDCPFCFVDQNPAGMRQSLYFRDEDFRLSFLAGHYVTLTNISKRDLERIVEQRLSPLYISVHALDPQVRRFLLGLRRDDRLTEKLEFLTANGIELHTQIVLCPGHNDGEVLQETLQGLARYFPQIRSVALVPLGLTKHREGLTPLTPVTPDYAGSLIDTVDAYGEQFRKKLGMWFAYPSDEFYILAGRPIPDFNRYDNLDQLENGIGMVRSLLGRFETIAETLPRRISTPLRAALVTGTLMGEIFESEIVARLRRVENFLPESVVVPNTFYGETIRVSGLLTGRDICRRLEGRSGDDVVFLPDNCLNDNDVFLDDWTRPELETRLGVPVIPVKNDFAALIEKLEAAR